MCNLCISILEKINCESGELFVKISSSFLLKKNLFISGGKMWKNKINTTTAKVI